MFVNRSRRSPATVGEISITLIGRSLLAIASIAILLILVTRA